MCGGDALPAAVCRILFAVHVAVFAAPGQAGRLLGFAICRSLPLSAAIAAGALRVAQLN